MSILRFFSLYLFFLGVKIIEFISHYYCELFNQRRYWGWLSDRLQVHVERGRALPVVDLWQATGMWGAGAGVTGGGPLTGNWYVWGGDGCHRWWTFDGLQVREGRALPVVDFCRATGTWGEGVTGGGSLSGYWYVRGGGGCYRWWISVSMSGYRYVITLPRHPCVTHLIVSNMVDGEKWFYFTPTLYNYQLAKY